MDKLFKSIHSGGIIGTMGQYIKNSDGLCAGFLVEPGSCGESRTYALFEVDHANALATFSRFCTKREKKLLGKAHYHYRALRNVETRTTDNSTCLLFTFR